MVATESDGDCDDVCFGQLLERAAPSNVLRLESNQICWNIVAPIPHYFRK
jgi:hypothetical protein